MVNQGRSIPLTFRFVGMLFVFGLIAYLINTLPETIAIIAAILLSLLIPLLWFSFQILTIDTGTNEIHYGTWLMGYKTGKVRSFGSIEKFYINQVSTSQNMYSQTNRGHTVRGIEYHAFIKLDDGEKYFLTSDKDEKKLEEKVTKIREKLDLD